MRPRSSGDRRRIERLLRRYARFGDEAARAELVERFLPLARRLARRYRGRGDSIDDLNQVASIGLLKAIERFDPERGNEFTAYAIPTMLGELKRHFRDYGWAVGLPRSQKERVLEVNRHVERLSGTLGRPPTPAELAGATGLDVAEVGAALDAAAAARPASLDANPGENRAAASGCEDPRFELVECRERVSRSLRGLSPREHHVLYLRFVEDLTQEEIGKRIGVSQMHVSRILRAALEHSRRRALADPHENPLTEPVQTRR